MSQGPPPVIDAGPALTFLSVNQERLLLSVVGARLSAPEFVEGEVLGKAQRDGRFAASAPVWRKLRRAGRLVLLDDDTSDDLSAAVEALTGLPASERRRTAKDYGEVLVVAHAVVMAEQGQDVVVIVDDGGGVRLAEAAAARLDRLRRKGRPVGALTLTNTVRILGAAAGGPYLPDVASLRTLYPRLRALDDGLLPLERTGLLDHPAWR